jgi:hypothetical protein
MSWFPQIGAGSMAQLPLRRTRRWRSISNQLESYERILLPDPAAGQVAWNLALRELTNAETGRINDLFTASQGQFDPFSFIDPMANLLGWSEDVSRPDWQPGLLTLTSGITDPIGTTRAWSVANHSAGEQKLQQTRELPGDYVGCFSAWLRSDAAGKVTVERDGRETIALTGPVWKRFFATGTGSAGSTQSTFSIAVAAGQTIQIWGLQAEAQPYPSQYKQTTVASGIYEETYFGVDELRMTSTGPGLSACEIVLWSRV